MTKGRKSAAALATPTPAANRDDRPTAPVELSDFEADVWRCTVDAMPADWFNDASLPLLVAYCRHVGLARILDDQIAVFEPEWIAVDGGLDRLNKLTTMRERQTRAMLACARSMRLTHQSRIHPQTAGTGVSKALQAPRRRPWQ